MAFDHTEHHCMFQPLSLKKIGFKQIYYERTSLYMFQPISSKKIVFNQIYYERNFVLLFSVSVRSKRRLCSGI